MLSAQPEYARERLREVRAVVIDEAHQFYGTRRGLQLYCLLERLKSYTRRPLQRICLSATVATPNVVGEFFRGSDAPIEVLTVPGRRRIDLRIALVGAANSEQFGDAAAEWVRDILSRHRKVLLFANTRAQCDWLCWHLTAPVAEKDGVPVLLHYSSLHKDYRKWVEHQFRRLDRAICVATSTLELGVDIGNVDAVAMWGAPNSVTGFLQRIGRGNRRTDTSVVYAACPQFHPSDSDGDPDSELLTFVGLVYCALMNELEVRIQPHFYSVLLQQLLALCRQWDRVAPDAFTTTVLRPPEFAFEQVLLELLNAMTERGVLQRDARRNLWLPTEKFYNWLTRGVFWSNIGGQETAAIISDTEEKPVPLAEIPRHYALGLRPGKVVVLAGKPRLVTRVDDRSVWVIDLEHDHAELAKYLSPPEPVSETVVEAIREVLTLPSEKLAALPILYDDWSRQRLLAWREHLGGPLRSTRVVTENVEGRWVVYTFAGSVCNWLLRDLVRTSKNTSVEADAWRLFSSSPVDLQRLSQVTEEALRGMVQRQWKYYLRILALPPLFMQLPIEWQEAEVQSILQLSRVANYLRELANN